MKLWKEVFCANRKVKRAWHKLSQKYKKKEKLLYNGKGINPSQRHSICKYM